MFTREAQIKFNYIENVIASEAKVALTHPCTSRHSSILASAISVHAKKMLNEYRSLRHDVPRDDDSLLSNFITSKYHELITNFNLFILLCVSVPLWRNHFLSSLSG
jgi:hypothetical protein